MKWLYNRNGKAKLFLHEDRFISKTGENLGWLIETSVYSLEGNHLGWFEKGIMYDENNSIMAFLKNATGYLPTCPKLDCIPGKPCIPEPSEKPGLCRMPFRTCLGGWSKKTLKQFFRVSI